MSNDLLKPKDAVLVFAAFASAYFISTLIRAITATLSPVLTQELSLQAHELGLLAGGFSLGFAMVQIPMGDWLDRYGPKKTALVLMGFAVLGCIAFALAQNFYGLWLARILTGVGVSGCLMAPLTGNRRWLTPASQMRANSWLLMAGSLGMLMSTLPVQWLLPITGWRVMFMGVGVILLVSMLAIFAWVPRWQNKVIEQRSDHQGHRAPSPAQQGWRASYSQVMVHPYFRRTVPIGFMGYGSLLAIQTLWAGPWMVNVDHYSQVQSAQGLFAINLAMMFCFGWWGWAVPRFQSRGITVQALVNNAYPLCLLSLGVMVFVGPGYGAVTLTCYCLTSSVIAMVQPTVGLSFPSHLAGKALCAYNLVIFLGIFAVQWGLGLMIDAFGAAGFAQEDSYKAAFFVDLCCCSVAFLYFLMAKDDNSRDI
jgi:MFS family permease